MATLKHWNKYTKLRKRMNTVADVTRNSKPVSKDDGSKIIIRSNSLDINVDIKLNDRDRRIKSAPIRSIPT